MRMFLEGPMSVQVPLMIPTKLSGTVREPERDLARGGLHGLWSGLSRSDHAIDARLPRRYGSCMEDTMIIAMTWWLAS